MIKTYRYRAYPTDEQVIMFNKTVGCCRLVWNTMIDLNNQLHESGEKALGYVAMSRKLTELKHREGFEFLNEVSDTPLRESLKELQTAYDAFFKRNAGFPKFRKKRYAEGFSFQIINENSRFESKNHIRVPKIGNVRVKNHVYAEGEWKELAFKRYPSGKYYICVTCEVNVKPLLANENQVGLDLGVRDFVVASNGEKFNLPELNSLQEKLVIEQRKLSRKKKGSKNRNKQRIKVARIQEKIANIRKYQQHKLSKYLVNTNGLIVVEDLDVSNMFTSELECNRATHSKNRSIAQSGMYQFRQMLKYKCEWYGRTYIEVDRYYPSSQLCSICGYQNPEIKNLSVRSWECPECGSVHDRDVNAAVNILNEGIRLLNA